MTPLDYVNHKIAEVIRNPNESSHQAPSSSQQSQQVVTESGQWGDKQGFLHPLDAARYGARGMPSSSAGPVDGYGGRAMPSSSPVQVESSTHRDYREYIARSPIMRSDEVSSAGGAKRSPRPVVHSQGDEVMMNNVTSLDDAHGAAQASSTMKPPPSQSPSMMMRDYRPVGSPLVSGEVYAHARSPRPGYQTPDGRPPSRPHDRSPKFSPVSNMDMVVSGSMEDMRPQQSGLGADQHGPLRRSSAHSQDESAAVASQSTDSRSPQAERMVIDESRGTVDSSGHLDRFSPASESSQHAISTSSRDMYMDIDSQSGKHGRQHVGAPRPHSNASSDGRPQPQRSPAMHDPQVNSSTSIASSIHVDSSRYSNPHYSMVGVPHSMGESTQPTSTSVYNQRFMYSAPPGAYTHGMPPQHSQPRPHEHAHAAPAPSRVSQEQSPLLSSQYETLSDDE
jgi:hypothetical protein